MSWSRCCAWLVGIGVGGLLWASGGSSAQGAVPPDPVDALARTLTTEEAVATGKGRHGVRPHGYRHELSIEQEWRVDADDNPENGRVFVRHARLDTYTGILVGPSEGPDQCDYLLDHIRTNRGGQNLPAPELHELRIPVVSIPMANGAHQRSVCVSDGRWFAYLTWGALPSRSAADRTMVHLIEDVLVSLAAWPVPAAASSPGQPTAAAPAPREGLRRTGSTTAPTTAAATTPQPARRPPTPESAMRIGMGLQGATAASALDLPSSFGVAIHTQNWGVGSKIISSGVDAFLGGQGGFAYGAHLRLGVGRWFGPLALGVHSGAGFDGVTSRLPFAVRVPGGASAHYLLGSFMAVGASAELGYNVLTEDTRTLRDGLGGSDDMQVALHFYLGGRSRASSSTTSNGFWVSAGWREMGGETMQFLTVGFGSSQSPN